MWYCECNTDSDAVDDAGVPSDANSVSDSPITSFDAADDWSRDSTHRALVALPPGRVV